MVFKSRFSPKGWFLNSRFLRFLSNPTKAGVRPALWRATKLLAKVLRGKSPLVFRRVHVGFATFAALSVPFTVNRHAVAATLPSSDAVQLLSQVDVPPLAAHRITRATVANYGYYSAISVGKNFVLPWRQDTAPLDLKVGLPNSPVRAMRDDEAALTRHRTQIHVPRAIYAGSRSPKVWAHWLVNFLPTAYLASKLPEEYDDFPLMIPANIPRDTHWSESLAVILNGRPVVQFDPGIEYLVEDLVCFDPAPVYDLPFAHDTSRRSGIWLYADVMIEFRQTLLTWALQHNVNSNEPHRRIFIARRGQKRQFNQDAAIEVARDFGFHVFYAEDMTFSEKIRRFHEAQVIVGPGGSGMANILFCQPAATVFNWWPFPLKATDNFDANLALIAGATLEMASLGAMRHLADGAHEVDLAYLRKALTRLTAERNTRR
jgi:hypothetical protein